MHALIQATLTSCEVETLIKTCMSLHLSRLVYHFIFEQILLIPRNME